MYSPTHWLLVTGQTEFLHQTWKLLPKTDGLVDKYTIDTGIIVDNSIIYTLAKRLVLTHFDVIWDLLPNRRTATYATYAFFSIRSQKKNSSFQKLEKKFRGRCIARNNIGRRIRFHGCHCVRPNCRGKHLKLILFSAQAISSNALSFPWFLVYTPLVKLWCCVEGM